MPDSRKAELEAQINKLQKTISQHQEAIKRCEAKLKEGRDQKAHLQETQAGVLVRVALGELPDAERGIIRKKLTVCADAIDDYGVTIDGLRKSAKELADELHHIQPEYAAIRRQEREDAAYQKFLDAMKPYKLPASHWQQIQRDLGVDDARFNKFRERYDRVRLQRR